MTNSKFKPQSAASKAASSDRLRRFAVTLTEIHKAKVAKDEEREHQEYLRLKDKFEAK